ncbi:MAG: sigma 54-interacting transcriptional regulator, partial [Pseudomonadota bacterium]
ETVDVTLFGQQTHGGVIPGVLQNADGGIVFLDDVSDLPLQTQSRLMRVLVDQTFQPVGDTVSISADVRIISATSKNLEDMVNNGQFREELFHRLNVVPVAVPGLSERREDIPLLADRFLDDFHQEQGLPKRMFSPDAVAALQSMMWPGNIRQLRNVIERILILGGSDPVIDITELPSNEGVTQSQEGHIVLSSVMASLPLREAREVFEREYLLTQIDRFGGNISRTANFVGMERSALHRKLKSLGVITSDRGASRPPRQAAQL